MPEKFRPDDSLKKISKMMRDLDFCMMTTRGDGQELTSRPMSNNGNVEYDGDSYFFSSDDQPLVQQIETHPSVNLSFMGEKRLFVSVVGEAELIRDRELMKPHWRKSLEMWFKDGLDTAGLVMICVKGKNIKYWQDMESGEVTISKH